ncbi:cytochrome P460 family protein [Nitratireductor sp. GCM10026969]|uniref:cytochrome P460 family protein n=1 Tax=Nitratireductor sp. GCM10026969 TaxID=3252645 RepID=UPI003612D3D5
MIGTRTLTPYATVAALLLVQPALGQEQAPPFGGPDQVDFAEELWQALEERGIVGEDAIQTHPYAGTSMHGPVIQYLSGKVTVADHTGTFILKRNYRGEDLSVEETFRDPLQNFDSMGVMFRREEGYAPDSGNWFWVKFMPDGAVATTPDGANMAGRIAPCIGCHQPAEGGDFVFSHDRFAQ